MRFHEEMVHPGRRCRSLATTGMVILALALMAGASSADDGSARCDGRIVTIHGTPGRDVLRGTPGDDVIDAGRGQDIVHGLGGDDVICGGGSRDTLHGGPGRDRLLGGQGADELFPGEGRDHVDGGGSAFDDVRYDTAWAGPVRIDLGRDVVTGAGVDVLIGIEGASGTRFDDHIRMSHQRDGGARGLDGDDTIVGGPYRDSIEGGEGIDVLSGGRRADRIEGGAGPDVIRGGPGSDNLFGATGADRMSGGAGRDIVQGGAGVDEGDGGLGTDLCDSIEVRSSCEMVS